MPTRPSWLDAEARRAWAHVVEQLGALGVVGAVDLHALALFCATWSRWRRVDKFLAKNGETYAATTREGDTRPTLRPEASLSVALLAELRQQGDRLGLNPSARARLDVAVAAPTRSAKPRPWALLPGAESPKSPPASPAPEAAGA